MKRIVFLLLALAMGSMASNPCEDANYLGLKEKKIDEMSEREFQFFSEKDRACTAYYLSQRKQDSTVVQTQKTVTPEEKKNGGVKVWEIGLLLYGVAAAISALAIISIIN